MEADSPDKNSKPSASGETENLREKFLRDIEEADGEPEPKLSRLSNSTAAVSKSSPSNKESGEDINVVETEINSLKLSGTPSASKESVEKGDAPAASSLQEESAAEGSSSVKENTASTSKESRPKRSGQSESEGSSSANDDGETVIRITTFRFTPRKRPRNFRARITLGCNDDEDFGIVSPASPASPANASPSSPANASLANASPSSPASPASSGPAAGRHRMLWTSSSNSEFSDIGSLSDSSSSSTSVSDDDAPVHNNPFSHFHFPGSFSVADQAPENVREACLLKPGPKHKWFCVQEFAHRQIRNCSKVQTARDFERRCAASLHCVQRLKLSHKLKKHTGCVNTLSFNQRGDLLLSGSDDRKCIMWNWAENKVNLKFETGHWSNVFNVKFLPHTGDTHVVTCGRDGQVRLALLGTVGQKTETRQLVRHSRPVHKITTLPDNSHIILSCGEDGIVNSVDLRNEASQTTKLLKVIERNRKLELYSIHVNPLNPHQFIVAGQSCTVRLYDMRKIPTDHQPLMKFYPHTLGDKSVHHYVTSAVFNHNGTEILASYNYESIYLFDAKKSSLGEFVHCYEGHQNCVTIKGVNFFGPSSEYIVSGSDCGNIFIWEKETEAIVQCMPGDDKGVVNVLEPHPAFPFMATSGLDNEVKVWTPSGSEELSKSALEQNIAKSNEKRKSEDSRLADYLSLDPISWIDAAVSAIDGSRQGLRLRRRGRNHDEDS